MQLRGDTPALCGSMQTPMKLRGNKVQTRWISSLQAVAQASLVDASPRWCPIPAARGEKIVRSVPRSCCTFNCPLTMVARISSSVIAGRGGAGRPSLWAATCSVRHASCWRGDVV